MGYPVINTPQEFSSYVAGVHQRLGFTRPHAFGVGALRYGPGGGVVEAIFPKVNRGENFGSAAAFADVAHYRSGNTVYEMDFFDFKTLEQLFFPFLECADEHPNVAAFLEVNRLMCSPYNMKPVIVFVGDVVEDVDSNKPAFVAFLEALERESPTITSVA